MKSFPCFRTVALAAAVFVAPLSLCADDVKTDKTDKTADKSAEKTSDKPVENAPPADSTTEGTVDAGGQHIAYTAIAGTLTVGATDVDDAQLGMDGKPQAGSQLANAEPKEAKDANPMAHIFYVAYFK